MNTSFKRNHIYDSADDFFNLEGHAVMKLTPVAACNVCERAASVGMAVVRIEGGIWHNPGFEARLDCIWDGKHPSGSAAEIHADNLEAARFICDESTVHQAFILTVQQFTEQSIGWINSATNVKD